MPFPNEHARALSAPSRPDTARQKHTTLNSTSRHHVFYIKGRASTLGSWRYAKAAWSIDEAREHCKEQPGTFEPVIEVKSGRTRLPGMAAFATAFTPDRTLLVGGDGIAVEEFLSKPAEHRVH